MTAILERESSISKLLLMLKLDSRERFSNVSKCLQIKESPKDLLMKERFTTLIEIAEEKKL